MSLDYDLTRMVNREVHFPPEPGGDLNGTVQSLIWLTIPVGINEITTANALEFYKRATLWIEHVGAMFSRMTDDGPEPIKPTLEEVMAAAGLHTNASRLTRTQFMKKFTDAYFGA